MIGVPLTGVPVLGYHSIGDAPRDGTLRWSVPPGAFDEQMALLRQRGRTPLTVSHYADLLRGRRPLPPRPVLVTFDDGFSDLVTTALAVLRRYQLPATAYVITVRIGTGRPVDEHRFLDWEELDELRAHGVEIGSHGHTHRALDCLSAADLRTETVLSRHVLEEGLQEQVRSFAYPYGYHSPAVHRAVRAAGYTSACAVKNALSHAGDDAFAIARVLIERGTRTEDVDALLDGRGRPMAWHGERVRTRAWRAYRRTRRALDTVRRSGYRTRTGLDTP